MKNIRQSVARLIASGMLVCGFGASACHAASISFSFSDVSGGYSYGRQHIGGSITGLLLGLADNGTNLLPTAIQFTSDLSAFGMTDTLIDANNNPWFWDATGFNIENGVVTGGGLALNFDDPVIGGLQFRLNSSLFGPVPQNIFQWNGSSGPVVAIGNDGGFAGASYAQVSAVPLPGAAWLFGSAVLGYLGFRRRSNTGLLAARSPCTC